MRTNKILIIRFSSIGDIVLTTPVVRCLNEQLENAEIHYLTKRQYAPVITASPHIHKIWFYDGNFGELLPQLRDVGFDYIVDLHKNLRSFYVRRSLGVHGASFPKLNVEKWLLVRLRINRLPGIHIVDRYFMAASHLKVRNDNRGLDYFIPPADEVALSDLPENLQNGYIALVIGGKHNTKVLPESKAIEVCKGLNRPVILLGGPEDADRGERIANQDRRHVYNACGRYNLNQAASLIRQSSGVISNDTGLMHIAAAFMKPIVSVWGNTIPAFGMYPYMPGSEKQSCIAEVSGLTCRPCSKLGFDKCPEKHFRCMMDIDTNMIVKRLTEMIA